MKLCVGKEWQENDECGYGHTFAAVASFARALKNQGRRLMTTTTTTANYVDICVDICSSQGQI